jgi:hypothetical protein
MQHLNKVSRLSGLALAALLVASPSLVNATQIPSQIADSQTDAVMLAQFRLPRLPTRVPTNIPEAIDTVNTVLREFERMQQQQRREEERQLREINRIRQREEREARAREAARQRQAYFESLTPEQQQAYIEEQRRRQQVMADLISTLFLGAIMSDLGGGGSSPVANPSVASAPQVIYRDDETRICQSQSGDQCESFQIVSSGNLLFFAYYFNNAPFSFIASAAEPIQQTESVTAYAVGSIMIIDEMQERLGHCVVGRLGNQQYHQVICSTTDGLEFEYMAH